jgi:hypothetical protein
MHGVAIQQRYVDTPFNHMQQRASKQKLSTSRLGSPKHLSHVLKYSYIPDYHN